jgi:hypothetical protein
MHIRNVAKKRCFHIGIIIFVCLVYELGYAETIKTGTYVIDLPRPWQREVKENQLILRPQSGIKITIKKQSLEDANKRLSVLKKGKKPVNLFDVLAFECSKELKDKGYSLEERVQKKKLGIYNSVFCTIKKGSIKKRFYVFEKNFIFTIEIEANTPLGFGQYLKEVEDIISDGFSVKAGNPIYILIGMSIAYVASFIGLFSAYRYYKLRKRR